jgi:hypothetical protein
VLWLPAITGGLRLVGREELDRGELDRDEGQGPLPATGGVTTHELGFVQPRQAVAQ